MYRVVQRQEVLYGHFKEFADLITELNGLLRDRGMAEFQPWAPTAGKANEILLVSEYPDLATFEREGHEFESDPEIMKVWRSGAAIVVQGSAVSEILEPAPDLA